MPEPPLRALIVDDEPAARRRLALLCAELAVLRIVGEAADGAEALAAVAREATDLVFLDIEMPGMDGMATARALGGRPGAPAVVFVTAFERFAVAAFGVNAAGYLLKPVDPRLLAEVVARLAAAPRPARAAEHASDAFWVPHRGELVRLSVDEVDWIAAEGDYVRLHAGARSFLLAERLYELEARLDADSFVRIHRSTLVRRGRVTALRHVGSGAWELRLGPGVSLSIGRSYLSYVRTAFRSA